MRSWTGCYRLTPPAQFCLLLPSSSRGRLRAMRTTGKWTLSAVFFALAAAMFLPACDSGGSGGGGKYANIKPGTMPPDASWNGVYFNPQYGNLHLVETGGSVAGKWKRTDGSA